MVDAEIEASLSPEVVWKAWARAFEIRGLALKKGVKSRGIIGYRILEVEDGVSYSILWKSLLTKLVYTYSVKKAGAGCVIHIHAKPKGFFFWMIQLTLKNKIQRDLQTFLQDFVKALKNQA